MSFIIAYPVIYTSHTPTSPFSRVLEQQLNEYGEKFLQYMNPDLAAEDRATQGWPYTSLVSEVTIFPLLISLANKHLHAQHSVASGTLACLLYQHRIQHAVAHA